MENTEKNIEMNETTKTTNKAARNMAITAGIGAVIGAAAALLFAPKKGSELRADIKEKSVQAKEKSLATMESVKTRTQAITQKLKERKAEAAAEQDVPMEEAN